MVIIIKTEVKLLFNIRLLFFKQLSYKNLFWLLSCLKQEETKVSLRPGVNRDGQIFKKNESTKRSFGVPEFREIAGSPVGHE